MLRWCMYGQPCCVDNDGTMALGDNMPRETFEGHMLNYMWIVEPPDSDTTVKISNFCHTCAADGLDPNACEKIALYNESQTPALDG